MKREQSKFIRYFTVALSIGLIILSFFIARKDKPPAPVDFFINPAQAGPDVRVYMHKADKTDTMSMEDYIVGVTAAEVYATYDPEALKAQAVCARTYAIYKQKGAGCQASSGADVCTNSAHCQAYATDEELRQKWGSDYSVYIAKIRKAVKDTAGEVITYGGKPIEVMYHAVSGGKTEDAENVYGNSLPYLKSVDSAGEESAPKFHAQVSLSRGDFAKKINEYANKTLITSKDFKLGDISRFDSGRVDYITIGNRRFSGTEMRKIFGLNSANFTLDAAKDPVVFETTGYGHGVGLSQAGANAMALRGSGYVEIVQHYFTGAEVVPYY